MKYTLTISVLTLAALGGGIMALAQAQQPDPFVGTWKLNLAKSHYDPASLTPKAATIVKREASGAGYKVVAEGVNAQGPYRLEYTVATLDGKDYPATGFADYDSASLKRIDSGTMIYVNKRNGNVVRTSRMTASKDGRTTTFYQVGYNAQGVAFYQMAVYDRQ